LPKGPAWAFEKVVTGCKSRDDELFQKSITAIVPNIMFATYIKDILNFLPILCMIAILEQPYDR
jgi:hypothetical protein